MTLTDVSTTLTLKMTSAQVVETSVNVISNSRSQDYTHPDGRTLLNDMTPGFKPFTISLSTVLISIAFIEFLTPYSVNLSFS